jgi:hypothetical protein
LRERIEELQKKAGDPAVRKELAEIRAKLMAFNQRRMNPVLAETVTLQVAIAADAEPGPREADGKAAKAQGSSRRLPLGTLPAIPFVVRPNQ